MIAEIKRNGEMMLTPETDLENYALDKWFESFLEKGTKEKLVVNLFVTEPDHPTQSK